MNDKSNGWWAEAAKTLGHPSNGSILGVYQGLRPLGPPAVRFVVLRPRLATRVSRGSIASALLRRRRPLDSWQLEARVAFRCRVAETSASVVSPPSLVPCRQRTPGLHFRAEYLP